MKTEKFNTINAAIWDVFKSADTNETFEIGNGYVLQFCTNGTNCIWDWGVSYGRIDEDGSFKEDGNILLNEYAETIADLLEEGQHIVESITNDIIEAIGE